jgi:small GTP-binding protein
MCSQLKKRIVLVGDSGCGKTALAVKLAEDLFLDFHEPTQFDDYQAEIHTGRGSCQLTILDTSGSHDCGNVRSLTYKSCDAVVICFDLTDLSTLDNVKKFWLPEVQSHCPNTPIYIAGCKSDAMCESRCKCDGDCCTLNEKDLYEIIERTGAVAYTECSAALDVDDGIEGLFRVVVETSSQRKKVGAKKMMSKIKKQSKSIKRRLSVLL